MGRWSRSLGHSISRSLGMRQNFHIKLERAARNLPKYSHRNCLITIISFRQLFVLYCFVLGVCACIVFRVLVRRVRCRCGVSYIVVCASQRVGVKW